MKIDINLIRSDEYKKIINDFVKPYSRKMLISISEFPFDEKGYYLEKMKNKPSINNFNLIKKIDVIYDIDQYIYGILNLNNIGYIVSVDNEFTISVAGTTESNWLWGMFFSNDYIDKFEIFMKECNDKLGIEIKQLDFEKNSQIEENILKPLILGNWKS
jgi:hypothetical protein